MHLVDAEAVRHRIEVGPLRHPPGVAPLVARPEHEAGGAAVVLGEAGPSGRRAADGAVGARRSAYLYGVARADAGDEAGPHAGARVGSSGQPRGPSRSTSAPRHARAWGAHTANGCRPRRRPGDVGAEHLPQPLVAALGEEVQVDVGRAPSRRSHGAADQPLDPAQRDAHQVRPVTELVDDLVHRLVELEGREHRRPAVGSAGSRASMPAWPR